MLCDQVGDYKVNEVKWPNLTGLGARLVVSPANNFRPKTAMLVVNEFEQFKKSIEQNSSKQFEQVLMDAHFYEVQNDDGIHAYYYKNPAKSGIDLNDLQKVFPAFTNDMKVPTKQEDIYLTNLPFKKNIPNWKSYFASATERLSAFPEVYVSKLNNGSNILDTLKTSLQESNKSYLAQFQSSKIPFNRLQDYGYENIFSKVYLDEESAMASGENLDNLAKIKLSPFAVPVNYEKDGSLLIIDDLRHIPEIFAHDPYEALGLNDNINLVHFAHEYESTFNQLIEHGRGNRMFNMSFKDVDAYVQKLASDLVVIDRVFNQQQLPYPKLLESAKQGIPAFYKDEHGTWMASKQGIETRLVDKMVYDAAMLRHDVLQQMVRQMPTGKVFFADLSQEFSEFSVNIVPKFNALYDHQSAEIKQRKLEEQLNESNVNEILNDLDVNFEATEKASITESDLLNIANDLPTPEIDDVAVLKELLKFPEELLDARGNDKVRDFAPSMLEIRQILDVYVIPKATEQAQQIEKQYSDYLNQKYAEIQDVVRSATQTKSFSVDDIQAISDEIDTHNVEISKQYNEVKKVLWQSETLVSGITSATNTFLFNKNSFYYAKDENGKFVGFESEVESNQHKADLFKLLSKQFDNQLVSIKTPELQEFVNNETAVDMLMSRTNNYVEQNINDFVAGDFSAPLELEQDAQRLELSDLCTADLANNDKLASAYFEEFTRLLDESNFDEAFLKQSLSQTKSASFLKNGVNEILFRNLLVPNASENFNRKTKSDSVPEDIFAKTSSHTDGFSLDRQFNRFVEVQSFQKALTAKYPQQDWSFITKDDRGENIKSIAEDMQSDMEEDRKDAKDLLSSIERQFYSKNSTLFVSNMDLAADEIYVQIKPTGDIDDLKVKTVKSNEFDENKHFSLSTDGYKATNQAYANIAKYFVEKTLYLEDGDYDKAQKIAALVIAGEDKELKQETKKVFGVELTADDLKQVQSMQLEDGKLQLNKTALPNHNYNNIQLFNYLNLIDINQRTVFGKFDVEVQKEFEVIKELLKPNVAFQNNVKYFSLSAEEENVQFNSESEYFNTQLENAVKHYEDHHGAIKIPDHDMFITVFQKNDLQYIRLYNHKDKNAPFIGHSVSLDANMHKATGFNDRDAVKTSANALFKLSTSRNSMTFMPPAKFTFEKYYESDLNFFKAKDSQQTLINKVFTSLPNKMFQYISDHPSNFNSKLDFISNLNSATYEKFEDLSYEKKPNEVTELLSNISPAYTYVIAHVDGQTAIMPKNLTKVFDVQAFEEVHPFDLVSSKLQKSDLKELFSNGINGEPDPFINNLKFSVVLKRVGNPELEDIQPRFMLEQIAVNEAFAEKYKSLTALNEVNTVMLEHVKALQDTVKQAYAEHFVGSNPKVHQYKLLNKSSQQDETPQLFMVDTDYEPQLTAVLLRIPSHDFQYQLITGFDDVDQYSHEILNAIESKVNFGTTLEQLALSDLPEIQIKHKTDFENKRLASLHFQTLITNTLGALYDQTAHIKPYIKTENHKLFLAIKPSTDNEYASVKLFGDKADIHGDYKSLCVFPVKSMRSVEDVLQLQNRVFTDFTFIDQLVPKDKYVPVDVKVEPSDSPATYLGDVGAKFGGAHKDRYGEYISLEYISATSADQTATDYRKVKIVANKEFQAWYTNTPLGIDDKIFVKAMYDYCPTKPLFSKNALMLDSQRATELRAYVAVVSNIRNLMVDTQEELIHAVRNNKSLSAESLGMTDRQRKDYIGLYSKGTKNNYKNYFQLLSNLNEYYIMPEHTGGISVQLEKIIEKTIDKELSEILSTGKIFDFYGKSKVTKDVSDAISNMQRTGLYSTVLEPYVLKSAIESGLVKAESAPIYVKDPVAPVIEATTEAVNTPKAPRLPSFTSEVKKLENGFVTEKVQSSIYGLLNYSRTGPDHRQGADVDSFKLKDDFSIRGVEVGNKVSPVAQQLVNAVYDSLADLKQLMGFKSNNGLLNLGVALASRGIKGSAAHFELSKNVVNLTRDSGSGSLAHEYGHALDAHLGMLEKAEVYKNHAQMNRSVLQDYYEDIPNFEIPGARHFLSNMLDAGYSPVTESGRAFEKVHRAMMNEPVQPMKNYGQVLHENAETAIKAYHTVADSMHDEVIKNKENYPNSTRKTLNSFFDWHQKHYEDLIRRQFEKIEEYLKKYEREYKADTNLSFFSTVQDKVDVIVSKINTDINAISFKSFERYQQKLNDMRQPEHHLPTTGLEEKITGVANAANVDLKTLSQNLSEYLIESSKYKFYNLVEKYMPEGVKNPHTQMQNFFDKSQDVEVNVGDIRFSDNLSRYKKDCLNIDSAENRATPYYATSTEMFARYFETYLYSKVSNENEMKNSFLIDGYPTVQPKGLEFEICRNLTEQLVETCVNEIFDQDLQNENTQKIIAEVSIEKENEADQLRLEM